MRLLLIIPVLLITCSIVSGQEENLDSLKTLTNVVKDSRLNKLNKEYRSTYKLSGYRVQIFSGNKKQPARQARMQFSQIYRKTKAHETYEQPYFKVRVGDFKTKIEALKFKNELVKHFPNCYIVKDEIEYKD
jgi:hypothetical protein